MKKLHRARDFLAGALVMALAVALVLSVAAAYQKQATLNYSGIQITMDGEKIQPTDVNGNPVEPFAIDGTTYLPVRAIANALGLGVEWEQSTQTVKLTSKLASDTPSVPAGTYSRLSPAPIGTIQSIQVESFMGNYNASAVVVESIRGQEAWKRISEANMYNSAPEDGMEYVLVKLRVSINSTQKDSAVSLSKSSFTAYSSDNVEYESVFVVEPSPAFSGNVFAGGTLEGYAVYQVSKSDPAPKLVFGEKYDGSGGIWFSLV